MGSSSPPPRASACICCTLVGPMRGAIPLVLIHGWPGLDRRVPRRNSAASRAVPRGRRLHPGYGFSGPTSERGVDIAKVAAAVDEVMAQLGYDRYVAQGGDWGALVVRYLGEHYGSRAAAIHTNMLFAPVESNDPDVMAGRHRTELAAMSPRQQRMADGTAYMEIQATRPHSRLRSGGFTAGAGRLDPGEIPRLVRHSRRYADQRTDRLIDNLMLYWLTGTATSAARLYYEAARAGLGCSAMEGSGRRARRDTPSIPLRAGADAAVWAESATTSFTTRPGSGRALRRIRTAGLFAADVNAYGDTLRGLKIF